MSNHPGQFKKGQSGNPSGRPPKNKALSDRLRFYLKQKDVVLEDGTLVTRQDAIANYLTKESAKGNMEAIKIVFDRTEGKPLQSIESDIHGKISVPNIVVVSDKDEEEE